MSLTESQSADIRPRLRNDVVFLRVETGIYLRSSEVTCVLKGSGAYEWMSALGPRMTGEWTIAELCEGLDDARRSTAHGLLNTLLAKGFARDATVSDQVFLPEPVLLRFAPQINFVEHFMHSDERSPQELFGQFRASRVLVTGPPGDIAEAAVHGLLRNGLAEVSLVGAHRRAEFDSDLAELAAAGTPSEIHLLSETPADLDDYDLIICAVDGANSATMLDLTRRVVGAACGGPRLFPVVINDAEAVIGPICGLAEQPCWVCAQLRLSANTDPRRAADFWRGLALGPSDGAIAPVSMIAQRMIGNAVAFEVFRLRTGQLGPDDESRAVVQDLTTLESTRERVLPHPLCPMPHIAGQLSSNAVLPPVTDDQSYGLAGVHLSPKLGVLSGWTDESIKQIPIKIGRVRLGAAGSLADGAREIAAFDIDVILAARSSAVRSAMSTYVGRLGPQQHSAALADGASPKVEAKQLDVYSGAAQPETGRTRDWLTVTSLHDGGSWRVPVAAVYPFSRANAGLEFEPTSSGAAADWSIEVVRERGLCSALAYRAAIDAVRSGAPLGQLTESALAADDEIAFLMDSLRHIGLRARVLVLPGSAPAFTALVVIDSATPGNAPDWSVASGFSAVGAVRAALRDAVGQTIIRHYEGTPADLGDPLIAELDPRVFLNAGATVDGWFYRPDVTMTDVLRALDEAGTRALFADTTTIDCRQVGGLVAGTVMLAAK